MRHFSPIAPLAALCLLAGLLGAQTTRVVPFFSKTYEGRGREGVLAACADMRKQVVFEGGAICPVRALLMGVAFRRDSEDTNAFAARTLHRKLRLDHVPGPFGLPSGTFDKNLTPNAVTVFDAALYIPAAAPAALAPAPFTMAIPFAAPFLFERSKGNLLLDVVGVGTPNTCVDWAVDNHFQDYGKKGLSNCIGTGCRGAGMEALTLKVDAYQLHEGGAFAASLEHTLSQPTAALVWAGLSASRWGAASLPLDLAFLGAPGCALRASLEWPVAVVASGGAFPPVSLPIPASPAYGFAELFAQGLAVAPGANPAGLVVSPAWRCLIWPATRPLEAFMSVTANSSTATGGAVCLTPEGPVTEWLGVFN